MKRISIICLSGMLFFAACHNTGSSTVGTYEQEETSESSEKSEGHGAGKENLEGESKAEKSKQESENMAADTAKTSADTTVIVHDSSSMKGETKPE